MKNTASSHGRSAKMAGGLVVVVLLTASSLMAQAAVVPFAGTLRLVETDLVLPAGAGPLAVTRAMPFEAYEAGLLGTRWRLAWESVLLRTGSSVIFIESEGPVLLEPSVDGSGYGNDRGDRLEFASDGSAVLTRRSGVHEDFDASGRLMRRRFLNGSEHRLHYGGDGLLRRVEGPKGHFFDLVTEDGRLRFVDASNGDRAEYSYVAGELTEVRVNGELTTQYGYIATGALSEITNPEAGTTTIAYDSEGRIIGRRFSDGSVEGHDYDDEKNRHSITDGGGGITTMLRSEDGTTLQVIDPLGNSTVTRFDGSGNPLTVRHPDGSESTFTYDDLDRVVSTVNRGGRMAYEYLANTDLMTSVTYPDGMIETFEFDDRGNLTQMVRGGEVLLAIQWREDGLQSAIAQKGAPDRSFDYLPNGLLESETVAGEGVYRYEYDDRGYLLRLTDPVGGATSWTYDQGGRVLTETDAAGGTVQLAYNERGLLERETNPVGGQWRYRYDSLGRRMAQTDPEGRTTEYVYDAAGRNTLVRLPGGTAWKYGYDAAGNIVRSTNPLGGVTKTTYDLMGRVTSVSDAADQVWTYEYGPDGELDAVRESGGTGIRYQRDAMGRVLVGTANSGRAETIERDERGRISAVSSPDGGVERLLYDDEGRLASTTDNRGAKQQFVYGSQGQIVRVRTAAGLETSLSHDAVGRFTGSRNTLGESLAITYDPRGLVASVRHGSGLTRYEYDSARRLTAVNGPLGGTRKLEYNLAGDLVGVTEASGDVSVFSYGADGGLQRVRTPGGGVMELDFDPMGNLVSEKNAVGGQRRYTHDTASRQVQQTDASGRVTKFIYDTAGRLSRRQLPDGAEISYSYDDNGRLIRVDDGVFPVAYGYDALGRRISIYYPAIDRAIRMEYTKGGLLLRVTDSDRGVVSYDYDESGRLASIRMNGEEPYRFGFDAGDRLISIGYPNGVTGSLDYGPDGTMESIRYLTPGGAILAGWHYEYDAAGNPLEQSDASGGATVYRYDPAGRLIEEKSKGGELRYAYGAGGNRALREDGQGRTEYSYDAANRLVSAGAVSFSHDPNGNLIEKRGPSGTTRYEWDVQDQLVAVTQPNGETVRFGYAPTGERVWREDSGGRVYYISDGTHVLAELDGDRKLKAAYLHGPGIDQPLLMLRDGRPHYLHARLLGTVAAVSDADGNQKNRFDIDGFGRVTGSGGDPTVPYLFTGRVYDHDLGIYYYRARYYDPNSGRFLSEDPNWGELDDTVQHNRYLYARNAPTRYRDPMGLAPDLFDDLDKPLSDLIGKVQSVKVDLTPFGRKGLNPAQYRHLRNLEIQNWKLQHQLIYKGPAPQTALSEVDKHLGYFIDVQGSKYGVKGTELAAKVEQQIVQHNQQLNQMIAKEAQRNLPVPAGSNSPVPVQPRAALRSTGPAPSGLTGATPAPLALPGNGPNTPLLPPGQGTGYKVLTRGRANLGTIPTRSGEVARGLAREGATIGLATGAVVLTAAGNYMMGNAVGERYKDWGRSRGRDPKLWSAEHGAASAEAGLRAGLGVTTGGWSEVAYWGGRTLIEQQRYHAALIGERQAKDRLQDQQNLITKGNYVPMMVGKSRELRQQANALRGRQQELIATAKLMGGSAKYHLSKVGELTPTVTAQECFDCQETSRRLRGTLSSLDGDLDTVIENARFAVSAAQIACTRRSPDAADFEAARSGTAAQEAQAASGKLGGQIELAKAQQARLAECLPRVDSLRPFLARIPEAEVMVARARKSAADSRYWATAAKRMPEQCASLAGTCRNLGYATSGMESQGELEAIAGHCRGVDEVCAAMAADATLGETYAGTAEVEVANIDRALANLKAISNQVGACYIDPIPAGELQTLQTAQGRVAGQLANASKAATRAAECSRLIAAGQPPPGPGGIGDGSGDEGGGTGDGDQPQVITASGGGDESTGQGGTPPLVDASGGGGTTKPGNGGKPPVVDASTDGSEGESTGEEAVTGILAPIGRDDGKITESEVGETQVVIRRADGRERLYSGQDAADRLVKAGFLTKRGTEYFPTSKFNSFGGAGSATGGDEETGTGTTDLPVKKPTTGGQTGTVPTGGTQPGGGQTTAIKPGTGGSQVPTGGGGGGGGGGTGGGTTGGVTPNTEGGIFGVTEVNEDLSCGLDVAAKMSKCNKSECGYASTAEIPDDVGGDARKRINACIENCRKKYQSQMDACYKQ